MIRKKKKKKKVCLNFYNEIKSEVLSAVVWPNHCEPERLKRKKRQNYLFLFNYFVLVWEWPNHCITTNLGIFIPTAGRFLIQCNTPSAPTPRGSPLISDSPGPPFTPINTLFIFSLYLSFLLPLYIRRRFTRR